MPDSYQSEATTVRRLPRRGAYDAITIHDILDQGMVCHVGFVADGKPFVIPTTYVRIGEAVYLHGTPASRMMRALADGAEVCLTVTLLDGLVLARAAFHHSLNYRSVVVLGTGRAVEEPGEKRQVLRALTEHLIPGRWRDVRAPSDGELKRTQVVAVSIREASAKVRTGGPLDEEADYASPAWAGVVPLRLLPSEPVADARLAPGVPPPAYAARYDGPRGV